MDWMQLRLGLLGMLLTTSVCLVAVVFKQYIDPGSAALAINYSLAIPFLVQFVINLTTLLEAQLVGVERVRACINDTESEPYDAVPDPATNALVDVPCLKLGLLKPKLYGVFVEFTKTN